MDVREKLVELLQDGDNPVWRWFPNNATRCQLADYLIAHGVTVQEWVSVKDRLPTKKDAKVMNGYLPAIENGRKPTIWKWTEVAKHPEYFTHWMPLPQPPKGENDGQ